ncbi:hypothetical protein TNCV_14091 [Trichonephila clavipes]|nr:hypothetical protein TNCV_14091 [Trichonephila clavipes]
MQMLLARDNRDCPVEGIETKSFFGKTKDSFNEITLSDVLYNPKLRRNLLSGSRLEKKAYVGVPKQIRKKLDMRAKLGVMMGYALHTMGYRIWLTYEDKLIETIDVRFDKNTKGFDES